MSVKSVGKSTSLSRKSSKTRRENPTINSIKHSSQVPSQSKPNKLIHQNTSQYPNSPKIQSRRLTSSRVLFKENPSEYSFITHDFIKSKTSACKTILTENSQYATTNPKISDEKYKNLLCKTTDTLSILSFTPNKSEITIENIPKSDSPENKFATVSTQFKSPIRISVSQYDQVCFLTFEEAFCRFRFLKLEIPQKKLWKHGFLQNLGKCWRKNKLEDENLEAAEQIIRFSLSQYSTNDNFHLSLSKSVYEAVSENYPRISQRSFNRELFSAKYPLIGMLNFLFLRKFFDRELQQVFRNFNKANEGLRVVFELTAVAVKYLRREWLNKEINNCEKCFEVFCFYFAGLVIFFNENLERFRRAFEKKCLGKKIKKAVKKEVYGIIKAAEITYE
ncbi:hypothetical protein SteCoe_35604 [Stentor coeruleus]|uniref:ELMO domain-containing protein n=1 Tax=Stentor coeruleus TaxID=5963 RepID=A0A1R2ARY9_9CILI|nr:hypothetical protein SteCoe_35604 [Stentor coeruleus]